MRPTFFGLEIGRTGLTVSRKGLDVTGHNIANVETAGYTRQRLVTTAYEPHSSIMQFKAVERGRVGSGSHVLILDQIRSSFLDRQFRTEQSLLSYWTTRTQGLTYVESLFEGSDMSTLSDGLIKLFDGFRALSTEANDREQRKVLQQNAISLTDSFNQIYNRLSDLQEGQNTAVEAVTRQINTIAENIAMLNKRIYTYELDGQPANDLRDKRNLLLDQLSALTDIEYAIDADNKMTVRMDGGLLVDHITSNEVFLTTTTDPLTGLACHVPCWDLSDPGNTTIKITGGELKAHMDLRDSDSAELQGIPYFMEQLNTLARALVQEINAQHKAGWTHAAAIPGGSRTGVPFFFEPTSGLAGITAGNIQLNPLIADKDGGEYFIAASDMETILLPSSSTQLQQGNNRNALLIYDLLNKSDIVLGATTIGSFEGFISSIVLDISLTLNHSKTMTTTQQSQVLSVDNQRTSISGVDLDEEMTNLIRYQHAYSGASRVITAMDEALDTLINRMGLVGRS